MGISVGIVGVGQFGQHFVQLFRDHPDVNRVAICDLNPDRMAACARKSAKILKVHSCKQMTNKSGAQKTRH